MADDLDTLEAERKEVLRQMVVLGDMRKGSITEAFRCCGKAACACHGADHPGHGPYYAFTTKVAGKTRTVQLRAGPRLDKLQREVETFKQFRALGARLIEVNEAICNARPGPGEADERSALKKTSRRPFRRRSHKK